MVQPEPGNNGDEFRQKLFYYLSKLRVRVRFYLRKLIQPVTKVRVVSHGVAHLVTSLPEEYIRRLDSLSGQKPGQPAPKIQ